VTSPSPESLRSRRRRETRQEIRRAAVRLAREHGFDQVTVDMISAAAGVCARTFFNYFPTKEAAVAYGPSELSQELAAEFVAAGPAPARQVLVDLTQLLARDLAQRPPQRDELHASFELAHAHPQVLAALLAQFDAFQEHIAEFVARRVDGQASDEASGLIAAVALAAVRQGLDRWSRATEGSPMQHVERSTELLHTLMAPENQALSQD
jgi:AcrR family transcriptional regulator